MVWSLDVLNNKDCFVRGCTAGDGFFFVEALPLGRWGVVCEACRDEGVAPTGEALPLQGIALPFVEAPPSGRWGVVCEAYRDEGVAPTGDGPSFCGSPALGAMGGSIKGQSLSANPPWAGFCKTAPGFPVRR
jgi:hypothetical protein